VENLATKNLRDRNNRGSGEARFSSLEALDTEGRPRWNFAVGEDVLLRFGYQIHQPVTDLSLYVSLLDPETLGTLTTIKAAVSQVDTSRCHEGTIELLLPKLPLRPGEYGLYAMFGDHGGSICYDVVDRNVDLPVLMIDSDDIDIYRRDGYFSLDFRMSAAANESYKPEPVESQ